MAVQATYTNGEVIAAASGGNFAGTPCRTVLTGIYDASRKNVVSGDVIPVVNIPAGTFVEAVIMECVTAQATVTFAVGKTGSTAGYLAATAVGTAGVKTRGVGALAVGDYATTPGGDLFATAGTIDLLVGAATASTAVVKVHVICTIA